MSKAELKVEIDQALLDEARAIDLDVQMLAVDGIRRAVAIKLAGRADTVKGQAWADENAEALTLHRRRIDRFGVFGEDLRRW